MLLYPSAASTIEPPHHRRLSPAADLPPTLLERAHVDGVPAELLLSSSRVSFFARSALCVDAMSFCRSCCGMSPKLSQQIERKLKDVAAVYPGTTCIVVLSREGAVIAQSPLPQLSVPEELHAPIASLKKTAVELGHALSTRDPHVVHLRGHTHTFTCYDVGKSVPRAAHTARALTGALS